MNTIVMIMGEGTTNQLEKRLSSYQVTSKHLYVQFAAKYKAVMIHVYTSGKIVFQGANAIKVASEFGYQHEKIQALTSPKQDLPLIGTDEVGNGSYFGSLAVVASFVSPDQHDFLRQLGIADSKQILDDKILQLAPLLKEKIPHQALLLTPQKYNQLVGQDKPYNAVSVKVALHNQAINLLLKQGVKAEKIIIDAFTTPKNYQQYVQQEKEPVTEQVTLETKAESKYLAVAVSSIIARQMFLDNLTDLGQQVGHTLPSGANAESDQIASLILKEKGLAGLEMTAKLHFANTKKAYDLLKEN